MKSMEVGLDLVTLPSHTSHYLQPLDVSVFAPFKCGFKRYRDAWVLRNRGRGASKEILAMWISAGLQRALTSANIKAGFFSTGIWPLDAHAVDRYLGPSWPLLQPQQGDPVREVGLEDDVGAAPARSHERVLSDDDSTSSASDDSDGTPDDTIASLLVGDLLEPVDNMQHYFLPNWTTELCLNPTAMRSWLAHRGAPVSPKAASFRRQCHLNSMPCRSYCF